MKQNSKTPAQAETQARPSASGDHHHPYHPRTMLLLCLTLLFIDFFVGCAPQPSTPSATPPQSQDTAAQRPKSDPTPQVEDVTHCNHPRFADTIVTYSCAEAFGCAATAQSPTKRNAIRFRVRNDCGGNNNYNFNGRPIQYGIYSVTSISNNHYHFHLMKKFNCMSNPMVIASNQLQDNRIYLARMIEDLNTPMETDLTDPIGSSNYGWVFRTGKYKGRPCKVE